LQPSDLVVIAARPSMGKTAWAINIAQRLAVHSEKTILVFSLEMSKEALLRRMLSSQALIDLRRIQTGNLLEVERETLGEALERLVESKIFIDDTANISLAELKSKATRLKNSAEEFALIVVDYLPLMAASGPASKQRFETEHKRFLQYREDSKPLPRN
jgi:replicative DNA helicase